MVKICSECGAPNIDNADFCTGCTTQLPQKALGPAKVQQPISRPPTSRLSRGSLFPRAFFPPVRSNLWKLFAVIFLAGLIVASFAWLITYAQYPPTITHTPVESVFAEKAIDLNATVLGGMGTQNVTLYYKNIDSLWKSLPMELDQGTQPFMVTIPASDVDSSITYWIEAIGLFGQRTHSESYIILVKDFDISLSNSEITLLQDQSGAINVNVHSMDNFGSSVSLSLSGLPSGVSHSFSQSSITPPKNGTQSSVLTISPSTSTSAGNYTLTIKGISAHLSRSQTMKLIIKRIPDFSFSITPEDQMARRGEAVIFNMTVTPLYEFNDKVTFEVSGLPELTSFTIISLENSTNYGGSEELGLRIQTHPLSKTGRFNLTITASGGGKTYTEQLTLTVRFAF
ncbi:MAG: zinc ribbon domain-containing protein [Candidatus Bathyarchaeota archaeon]|nr:zinc ribbon domain-containing protein [Candidatus Bathyarchaeota archaeon]